MSAKVDTSPTDAVTFWRDGVRWIRERGVEKRLLDIAPHLEEHWMLKHGYPMPAAEKQ